MYSRIIGTGSYLPEKILTNKNLESIVDTTDEWIIERTGIKQRHIAEDNESTSSMAINASIDAIKSSGISAKDIDLVIDDGIIEGDGSKIFLFENGSWEQLR